MKEDYKNIVFNVMFGLACLTAVCFLWKKAILLTIILAIMSAIGLSKWRNKETVILFFFCGIFGALTEAIAIYFNVWAYTSPSFIGIPLWLPILWGDAAIFSYQMAIEIKNFSL